ncbi:MAG: YggS family pyridoxal phosphate-dependent enzyme [Eubacterium sp.]|nr:YggS family pyridoxal phosphate-dependent enzyme [Eubacterium sp.]
MSELSDNLQRVEERIQKACARSGRDRNSVELIAVSKTKPVPMLMEAYEAGERFFGENKVQEIQEKGPQMPSDVRWHMIGHLQKNKLRYVVGKTELIHSVDTLELAEAIQAEAMKRETDVSVLLEVNVAGEDTKFGLRPEDTPDLAANIAGLSRVHIRGLMTVAPFVSDPEENRFVFRKLRQLSVDIARQNIDNVTMSVLSMGMTNDFDIAIEEGATCIRVGTALFGAREYKI